MGSCKWRYKSPSIGYTYITIVILLVTLLITTHEPPSRGLGLLGDKALGVPGLHHVSETPPKPEPRHPGTLVFCTDRAHH